jgi:metal-responsive CopG/Arc/MetJ family transcriptional regulator
MKIAISIPDDLYEEAEKLARKKKISRSKLYCKAVAEYIFRHEHDAITEAMDKVCSQVDTRVDPVLLAASSRTIKRSEW